MVSITEADLDFMGLPWRFLLWGNTLEVAGPTSSSLEARRRKAGLTVSLLVNTLERVTELGSGQPHVSSLCRNRGKKDGKVRKNRGVLGTHLGGDKGRRSIVKSSTSVTTVLLCVSLSFRVPQPPPTRGNKQLPLQLALKSPFIS